MRALPVSSFLQDCVEARVVSNRYEVVIVLDPFGVCDAGTHRSLEQLERLV